MSSSSTGASSRFPRRMVDAPIIEIDGIDETRRAIRGLDRDASRELRSVNKDMMSGLILRVRTTAAFYGPQASLAASRVAAKSDRYPAMSMGTSKRARRRSRGKDQPRISDLFWGAEFGSHRFPQFPARNRRGRFVWPQVRIAERELTRRWMDAVDDLAEDLTS